MKYLTGIFLFVFVVVQTNGQSAKPIVASDLMKIATTSNIQISPDGTKAVAVVIRKALKNENEYYYTRQLFLFDLINKTEPLQLTFGDRNDGQPQWSPDGKQIAFVRTDNDRSQIWILPLSGGEARVLTSAEFGANRPRWSPDGKKILFVSSIPFYAINAKIPWTYERPGRTIGDEPNFKNMKADDKKKTTTNPDGSLGEVRAWLAKNTSEKNPRVLLRQNIQGELDLQPDENFTHIFIQPLTSDSKAFQLTAGFQDFNNPEWMKDGKKVICESKKYELHPDRNQDFDLWAIDIASQEAKEFLKWSGYSLSNPKVSPDGLSIAMLCSSIQSQGYQQPMVAVVIASGEKPEILTQALDRDAGGVVWSGDSKTIFFAAQTEGSIPLYSVPAKGGAISKIIGDNNGVNDFDLRGDKIVYAITEIKNPWEIFLLNQKDKSTQQLTDLNTGWLKEKQISIPKQYWVEKPDGTKIQYWVMAPANKKEGIKYPTILNIHGGPSAMWGPGIFSMWHEYQLENSWGYGLVYCNPRGSGGYGDKFKKGNFKDWAITPMNDILTSLDDAMKNNSWIDSENLFLEGGSYAGYMVAWIIGHDNRFKAANAQRGVYDLTTFMGEGNAWRLIPEHFGGYPWDRQTRQLLDESSPYSFVSNIHTPLLIIHGDQDLRTGVIQSEMLYKSLKILNRPVEYIRYPKEGHELTRSGNPGRMMDHLLRVIEFFERYAKHPN